MPQHKKVSFIYSAWVSTEFT